MRNGINLRRLPGILTAEQTAVILGVNPIVIPILVKAKILKPLGKNIALNAPKQFASAAVLLLAGDPDMMHQIQIAISGYWKQRNQRKANADEILS